MAENDVEVVIGARELATAEIAKVSTAASEANTANAKALENYATVLKAVRNDLMGYGEVSKEGIDTLKKMESQLKTAGIPFQDLKASIVGAGEQSSLLEQRFNRLTDASSYLALGMTRVQRLVVGMGFGLLIGAVTEAVAALIALAAANEDVYEKNAKLVSSFESLGHRLEPLRARTEEYMRTQYELTRVQFEIEKIHAGLLIPQLEREIEIKRSLATYNASVMGTLLEYAQALIHGTSAEQEHNAATEEAEKKLELLKIQYQALKDTLNLTIPSFDEFAKGSKRLTEAQLEQEGIGRQKLAQALEEQKEAGLEQVALGRYFLAVALEDRKVAALEQEGLGRQILARSLEDQKEAGLIQIGLGRQILAQALQDRKEAALEQEALGRQILEQTRADMKERALDQEALGRAILEAAQYEMKTNQLRLQSYVDTTSAIKNLMEALYTFGGQKSRALFEIVKVASIAEAIVNTYRAANQVLADPTLPYFAKVAAEAAIITAGLANVARISATSFNGAGAGGAGGGAGAGAGISPGGPPAGSLFNNQNQLPPVVAQVVIHGNVIGTEEWVNQDLIPAIEDAVRNERSNLVLKK